MSSHNAVLEWMPVALDGLVFTQAVPFLWAFATRDMERTARYAFRIGCILVLAGWALFANGEWGLSIFYALLASVYFLIWWHSGGGDNFKKRLKKFKEKFVGQRRTAPQTA